MSEIISGYRQHFSNFSSERKCQLYRCISLGESNCSHLITWQPLGKHVFGARCLFEVKKTSLLIWALFVEVNIVRAAHFVQLEHCILFFDSLHFPRVIFAPLIPHDGLSCHGCGLAHPNPPIVPHQIAPSSPPPPSSEAAGSRWWILLFSHLCTSKSVGIVVAAWRCCENNRAKASFHSVCFFLLAS